MSLFLSRNEVQNLNKENLVKFLAIRVQEGAQIDYKENLSSDNKYEAYKEFLKDITAFANANGGLLFLGVKEPSENQSVQDQIVGLRDGAKIATDLERVAATSADPRIPGLLIKPVPISNNVAVIVVYIPPSMIRPHMVCYRKHRSFYIRHSESSVPMTTQETRDIVLNSATLEGRARHYAQEEEREALQYIIHDNPAFLLQAVPTLTISEQWDVLSDPIDKIIRGEDRKNKYKYGYLDLASYIMPTPTIKGVLGRESREEEHYLTEVHRTGYVQAIYMDIKTPHNDPTEFALHEGYADLFKAFCDLCMALWKATQTDIPYLFRCKYFNAETTLFLTNQTFKKFTKAYGRRQITWPEQIRQVGEALEKIYNTWTEQLFHAFGLNWKVPE